MIFLLLALISIYICELNEKYRLLTLACSNSTMLKDKLRV